MTDPIADMLTRIRNATRALLPNTEMAYSKMKESIAQILKREGYIAECTVAGDIKKTLRIKLKYDGRQTVIAGLKRISKPGLRRYVGAPQVCGSRRGSARSGRPRNRHRLHVQGFDDRHGS